MVLYKIASWVYNTHVSIDRPTGRSRRNRRSESTGVQHLVVANFKYEWRTKQDMAYEDDAGMEDGGLPQIEK